MLVLGCGRLSTKIVLSSINSRFSITNEGRARCTMGKHSIIPIKEVIGVLIVVLRSHWPHLEFLSHCIDDPVILHSLLFSHVHRERQKLLHNLELLVLSGWLMRLKYDKLGRHHSIVVW